MLGKGVVGGGGGTKAPKPSFVSYVRPEVRGRRAGGAWGRGDPGEGRREPLPCRGECRGALPALVPGDGAARRAEAAGARWGLRAGQSGDPGAGRQVPERRARPLEAGGGARAEKGLRPGTPLGILARTWGCGHCWEG